MTSQKNKSKMNLIQIKSYLLPEYARANLAFISSVDEIRHFTLVFNEGATGLYDNLIKTIKSVYGSSGVYGDEIRTYWQDQENELVAFSTDTDFLYAIGVQAAIKMGPTLERSSSLFKVYFKLSPNLPSNNVIHFRNTCNFCNQIFLYGILKLGIS